jgi:tRNA(adenine34) deaminase
MQAALAEARSALSTGDVPIGALVIDTNGEVIGHGRNVRERDQDPTGHAEVVALRHAAATRGSWRLDGCTLVVTLEPCTMCAAAISFARIRRLYFGAADPKGGAVISGVRFFSSPTCHHAPEVYPGIGEIGSSELLKRFFRERR